MSPEDRQEWVNGKEMLGNVDCADYYFYHLCLRGLITASAKDGRLRKMLTRDPSLVHPHTAVPPLSFERDIARGTFPHTVLFVCKAELDKVIETNVPYTVATTVQLAITAA